MSEEYDPEVMAADRDEAPTGERDTELGSSAKPRHATAMAARLRRVSSAGHLYPVGNSESSALSILKGESWRREQAALRHKLVLEQAIGG